MSKVKSMSYQVKTILGEKQCYGRSKHEDKKPSNNYHPHGIYSVKTFETYVRLDTQFCTWAKEEHGCKMVEAAREYIAEYLDKYSADHSPCSIHSMKFAIQKLYDCLEPGYKVEYATPKRERSKITKNRGGIEKVKDFNEDKYWEVLAFGAATGLRRHELLNLRYSDLHYDKETDQFTVHVFKGKGGKVRDVPVLRVNNGIIEKYFQESRGENRIFSKGRKADPEHTIVSRFPEHRCRRAFAQELYNVVARTVIPEAEKYRCRKDKAGKVYDKLAMRIVSEALGHRRIDVIAGHYLV